MNFILKGNATPVGPRWEEGFRDGYDNIVHNKPCPFEWWGSESGDYGNGYAEGLISGRAEMMERLKIDHWPPNHGYRSN